MIFGPFFGSFCLGIRTKWVWLTWFRGVPLFKHSSTVSVTLPPKDDKNIATSLFKSHIIIPLCNAHSFKHSLNFRDHQCILAKSVSPNRQSHKWFIFMLPRKSRITTFCTTTLLQLWHDRLWVVEKKWWVQLVTVCHIK